MINLTPPSTAAWLVSLLLGGAGIAGKLGYLSVAAPNAFWLLATAFVLVLLSTVFKGLGSRDIALRSGGSLTHSRLPLYWRRATSPSLDTKND